MGEERNQFKFDRCLNITEIGPEKYLRYENKSGDKVSEHKSATNSLEL